ncbi:homeodomain-only protein [Aulostomus maculatus]
MSSNMTSKAMERLNLTEYQMTVLENNFKFSKYPDGMSLTLIAAESGLSVQETQTWFQLRTALWRQAEGLPAQPGSVLD